MNWMNRLVVVCALALAPLAFGCAAQVEPEDLAAVESAVSTCPDVSGTDINRSLVVKDAEVLSNFGFKKLMEQLRTTANPLSVQVSLLDMYQRWMSSFGSSTFSGCNNPSVDPSDYGLACPRSAEFELASVDPFATSPRVSFEPVALFNRFDLAPSDGANCGEYRIVYKMKSTLSTLTGRGFIIFEAKLPNPNRSIGLEGCLPVARFWQSLSTDGDVASRAAKLNRFYFTGNAVFGFPPVARWEHLSTGQVRTNFFVDNREWQLREFKLVRKCASASDCILSFQHVTVKNNPAEELFAGTHSRSASFRTAFGADVDGLLGTTIPAISMATRDEFNEWESVSQTTRVVYKNFEDTNMRQAIQARLDGASSSLSVDNILDRATTQTCAGCHQQSNSVTLGGGLSWPRSLGFVHVDESGNLSSALTSVFLPERKRVLEKFINDMCVPSGSATLKTASRIAADPTRTIGGSAVGAPN